MLVSDLDYDLPDELIAQYPLDKRDASRMMILDRSAQSIRDSRFAEFSTQISDNDIIVLNNTRVFSARLYGKRDPSGARVELFLIRERQVKVWEALARPARRLSVGSRIEFGDGRLHAEVIEAHSDGRRTVRFECNGSFDSALEELGETPLPQYIKRDTEPSTIDRERYQTVYARHKGAIAAPTAGLHFTADAINELKERDVEIVEITLHVGYGTFQPVRVIDLADHKVASEWYDVSIDAARILNDARESHRRIIAVGTTTTRALESSVDGAGKIMAGSRMAELTITPGYKFRVVEGLITNFHLPQSSLLALVAAFAGHEFILAAYKHAINLHYRFYSYGDCMLIL
jgi:S-adenosylmethionine:tRNA ribosyltransferase-isomerase